MVVALLVMLALIGTAAMSTARIDRIASVQHVANTEIDMLAESVKQMVIGQLVNDLFSTAGPRTRRPTCGTRSLEAACPSGFGYRRPNSFPRCLQTSKRSTNRRRRTRSGGASATR